MSDQSRHFAIVTGASGGVGLELAKLAASDNHDLLIAADRPLESAAAGELRALGATVEILQVDLSTVGRRRPAVRHRPSPSAGPSMACSPMPAMGSARRSSIRTGTISWA